MKKIKAIIVLVVFTFSLLSAFSTLVGGAETIDFLELDWYDLEPWEIYVCSQNFETMDSEGSSFDPGEAVQLELFSGETIVTLQAEKSEVLPDNTTLVQISWYVQPLTSTVNFEVGTKTPTTTWDIIESGSATIASGYSGYHVKVMQPEENITFARLYVEEGNIALEVPVI